MNTQQLKDSIKKQFDKEFRTDIETEHEYYSGDKKAFKKFLDSTISLVQKETYKQVAGWFKFPYRKGMKVRKNMDGSGGLVNAGCEVCGGKLLIIRGKHPHEKRRKVCATCATEILESLYDNLSNREAAQELTQS